LAGVSVVESVSGVLTFIAARFVLSEGVNHTDWRCIVIVVDHHFDAITTADQIWLAELDLVSDRIWT